MREKMGLEAEILMLSEARAEVGIADHKASLVLAALGIGFGAVLGGLLAGDWTPTRYNAGGQIFWWTGAACALGSVFGAGLAVWPRFNSRDYSAGVTYWGHVAVFSSLEEFVKEIDSRPVQASVRTRQQLWRLSRIVVVKYTLVRTAMIVAAAAVGCFLIASAVGGMG